jgi:hypothetical protein
MLLDEPSSFEAKMLTKPQKLKPLSRDIFTLRSATEEDLTKAFLMGQDAWGDNAPTAEYLEMCRNSIKYRSGNWSILTLPSGQPLSSVISYAFSDAALAPWIGIGSLATVINERSKGYALMLFSDIKSGIYAAAGFQNARSVGYDEQAGNLMLKTSNIKKAEAERLLQVYVNYF